MTRKKAIRRRPPATLDRLAEFLEFLEGLCRLVGVIVIGLLLLVGATDVMTDIVKLLARF